MDKPFAPSCERNREPILRVLTTVFDASRAVLEIGSGTGQHAVFFAENLPHLHWYPSDLEANHAGIRAWIRDARLSNVSEPLVLDVAGSHWTTPPVDAVFTANTLHIIAWPLGQRLIREVGALLPPGGLFCVYGPFNYGGQYTSASNAQFDIWLKNRDEASAIRDFEDVVAEAEQAGLMLAHDFEMPANNRILQFRKVLMAGQR